MQQNWLLINQSYLKEAKCIKNTTEKTFQRVFQQIWSSVKKELKETHLSVQNWIRHRSRRHWFWGRTRWRNENIHYENWRFESTSRHQSTAILWDQLTGCMNITWDRESMKSTKVRIKRMNHNRIILIRKKSYVSDWIRAFLWGDQFDQIKKIKTVILIKLIRWNCYEKKKCLISMRRKKAWFHTDLFSDFQNDFSVDSLKLNF